MSGLFFFFFKTVLADVFAVCVFFDYCLKMIQNYFQVYINVTESGGIPDEQTSSVKFSVIYKINVVIFPPRGSLSWIFLKSFCFCAIVSLMNDLEYAEKGRTLLLHFFANCITFVIL